MDEKQIQMVRSYFATSEAAYCVASPSAAGGVSKEIKTNKKEDALAALGRAPEKARLFYFDGKILWMSVGK